MSTQVKKAIEETEKMSGRGYYLMKQQEAAIRQSLIALKNLPYQEKRQKFVEKSRDAFYKKYGIWISV